MLAPTPPTLAAQCITTSGLYIDIANSALS